MDANNPNDYYALGKLVCFNCPTWRECAKAGEAEIWGMWGGLTPQERKGTVKIAHGTREMYRLGCGCKDCAEAEDQPPPYVDIGKIPKMGNPVDIRALLYDLVTP